MPSVLITGTSTGIGRASALEFARRGYRTYATMRNPDRGSELAEAGAAEGLELHVRRLDVTDPASVSACIEAVEADADLDVIVNNAGVGGAIPLEHLPEERHKAMFEANYFGAIRVIQAALPRMRERRRGTFVNVSSVTGRVAVPNQVAYSASKWALECASEVLAYETRPFGIRVRIVEPGVTMTRIFDNSRAHTVFDKSSPYLDLMRRNGKFYAAGFRVGATAEAVAQVILSAAESDSDQLRYVVGQDARGWIEGRARLSDEEWIAMGDAMSEEAFSALFRERFGIDL